MIPVDRAAAPMDALGDGPTIGALLGICARKDGTRPYLRHGRRLVSYAQADRRVNRLANGLLRLGLRHGDRVAVMLANHPDHIYTFLACARLGLIQVPINTRLRGESLAYPLAHAAPRAVIAEHAFAAQLAPALAQAPPEHTIWRTRGADCGLAALAATADEGAPAAVVAADDLLSISYTSGTTGPPKGVAVTDRMFRASAHAVGIVAALEPGDVMFVWEPLFHIGGSQVIVAGLLHQVTLALVERFSASRFWDQTRAAGATRVHYLGGIMSLLLKQLPSPRDRAHPVRMAWGGGATAETRAAFERRFGVETRENYGMTECSSITCINTGGPLGSVGRPAPYFEVRIADEAGAALGAGEVGEILVRERRPGLIMRGYFRAPEATARALRDGWMHTGDLGRYDAEGHYFFAGRKGDSMRVRGENVSAWEVERVVNLHPAVEESAAIGVAAEIGEQEIKLFVKPVPGHDLEPAALLAWCAERLADFQVPRYLAVVGGFSKTPTLRIRKESLPTTVRDAWDRLALTPPGGPRAPGT